MVNKHKINARHLYKDDIWFRDPYGRYVIFRGVNFGARSKLAPYLPISPLKAKMVSPQELTNEIKSVTNELDLMKESGFNVVRFLLSWKALEPRPNTDLDHRPQNTRHFARIDTASLGILALDNSQSSVLTKNLDNNAYK